jgi:mRNA-degrading endonuclease RelE of RelBE toxin-antitoxin system
MTTIEVMARKQPFGLVYDPEIKSHLEAIERKYHSMIRETIEEQLRFEPDKVSRNRKQLERAVNFGARWELRLGPENQFRVFYRIDLQEREVHVLAVAVKERNRMLIAGEEVEL